MTKSKDSNSSQNNSSNSKSQSSSPIIPGLLIGGLAIGAGIGTANYIKKKVTQKKRLNLISKDIDLDSIKKLNFTPDRLRQVPPSPNLIHQEDIQEKLLNILKEEIDKILNQKNSLSTASSIKEIENAILIIRSVVIQNYYFYSRLLSKETKKPVREIIWLSLALTHLSLEKIPSLLECLINLQSVSDFANSTLEETINSVTSDEKDNKQILADVLRTFQDEESRKKLALLLKIYCTSHEAYTQGMNNVVAFILRFFVESEDSMIKTMILFFGLMKGLKIGQIFNSDFSGLFYGLLCVEKICADYCNVLYRKMVENEICSYTWGVQWFLTLFTYTFGHDHCVRIWDGILLYGFLYVLKVCGAVVKIVERMEPKKPEDFNKVISEFPKDFRIDIEAFLKMAGQFKVTYRKVETFIESFPDKNSKVTDLILKDLGIVFR